MARSKKSEKAPVTTRALVQRVGRALGKLERPELLRTSRSRQRGSFGDFFTVDVARHSVARKDVDLVKLARVLGVLEEWEEHVP